MMTPDTFPCQAWYVTEFGLQEVTLTGWVGRQMLWLNCRSTTKKKMVHAGEIFRTPEAAVQQALDDNETNRSRLQNLLDRCAARKTALLVAQALIPQKNNSKV